MTGLLILLGIAAALLGCLYLLGIVVEALRPPRRTLGWAMGRGLPLGPEDLDRPGILRTLRCADGVELPWWEVAGDAGVAGADVVLVHGWGRSRWDSLARVPSVAPVAARVACLDLRGHGEAPRGGTRLGDGDQEDVLALLGELAAAAPGRSRLLVGHSMGAGVAIRAAAQAGPEAVQGVIALAPYESLRTPIEARLRLRGFPARPWAWLSVKLLRLLGRRDPSASAGAAALRVPLLVVSAVEDQVSPASEGRAIAAAAGAGAFHAFPGADHANPGAGAPEAFAAVLAEFMARVVPAAPG